MRQHGADVHKPSERVAPIGWNTRGNDLPLSGVRIVDLTHMLAGPYCTWLLGALGADVVKVEMPGKGDYTRGVAPFLEGASIYFLSVNRNKRSITLNLKHRRGREVLLRLVQDADVFVENNRPGVMARLGLDYPSLTKDNPKLVYASLSGFGQTGPYSSRPSFDAVAQAMAGMMSITGEEGGGPVRVGASIGDISGGLFSTVGILAALHERASTGKGTHVDVAMLDSQVAMLENAIARFLNAGEVSRRIGSRHPLMAPFQAFPSSDEPIVVCVDTEDQWERLCEVLNRSDLVRNPLFIDGNARARNHSVLEPLLIEIFQTRNRSEWLAVLEAASIPAGPINTVAEVVEDPQIKSRNMISNVDGGAFVAQPIRMSSHTHWPESAAPALGEHTKQILSDLGYDKVEIESLRNDGTI